MRVLIPLLALRCVQDRTVHVTQGRVPLYLTLVSAVSAPLAVFGQKHIRGASKQSAQVRCLFYLPWASARWSQGLANRSPSLPSPGVRLPARELLAGPVHPHGQQLLSVAISADGQTLAAAAMDLYTFDLTTGKPLLRVPIAGGGAQAVAISPDMKTIAVQSLRDMTLVDRVVGQVVRNVTSYPGQGTLAYTPDGKTLISSGNSAIRFLDVATGTSLEERHRQLSRGQVHGPVARRGDGRLGMVSG
jgi:hypothetical protein